MTPTVEVARNALSDAGCYVPPDKVGLDGKPIEWPQHWLAGCPLCHSDWGALQVATQDDGSARLTCLSGCRRVDVYAKLGLEYPPNESKPGPVALDHQAGTSWAPVDLAEIVQGLQSGTLSRPAPTVGRIAGGDFLVYAGAVNGIAGESGSGKTWTALVIAAQHLAAGEHVFYVDYEDSAPNMVSRLLALGVDPAAITERFHYIHPEEASLTGWPALEAAQRRYMPTLVIIDSTGEALALDGANPNADEDVSAWFQSMPRRFASTGAAVLLLDHVTKAGGDEGLWPIGSQRKRAAISGAQYMQRAAKPFAKGQPGRARLICAKDRHGSYAKGQRIADLIVEPGPFDSISVSLEAPSETSGSDGAFRPTALMEKVSRALELSSEPLSRTQVVDRVTGKAEYVRVALDVLVDEGHVSTRPGPRGAVLHSSVKTYREADDRRDGVEALSASDSTVSTSRPLEGDGGRGHFTRSQDDGGRGRDGVADWPMCSICNQPLLLPNPTRDTCERCRIQSERGES